MQKVLYVSICLLLMASCSNKIVSNSSTVQNNNKPKVGGVTYPDGTIHYPDGTVRTKDGMLWPGSSVKTSGKIISKEKSGSIANDPNVTVVKKTSSRPASTSTNKSRSSSTVASKTSSSVRKTGNQNGDDIDVVTVSGNSTKAKSFPGANREDEVVNEVKKTTSDANTSARKDATGRHARKRGETYFRK